MAVDINADVGEGCGYDAALMPFITSANVAAGYHAGSPQILRETIQLAKRHGVNIGAHPGFNDRVNFGRRELVLAPPAIEALMLEQLRIVAAAATAQGVRMVHVKPHGALYNIAARNRTEADAIVRAIVHFDRSLVLFAPSRSALCAAAEDAGLRVAAEVFADRAYYADGSLVPRTVPGSVIESVDAAVSRAVRMVTDGVVTAIDGSVVPIKAETICVHGDTPDCVELAQRLTVSLAGLPSVRRSAS